MQEGGKKDEASKDVAGSVESFTAMVKRVTGKDDYKFGDLSKGSIDRLGGAIKAIEKGFGDTVEATRKIAYSPDYQFGDLTVAAAKEVMEWGKRERSAFESLTGKEYEFGDLTKFVSNSVVTKTKAVLGPDYQFGDLTKNLVKGATEAASSYKFGDLSRGVMKMFQDNVVPKMEEGMEAAGSMRLELLEQEKQIISQVLKKGSAEGAGEEEVRELLAQEMSYLESLCVDPPKRPPEDSN